MTLGISILSNTTYQILARISLAIGTLLGTILITRAFGVNTFGQYSIVTTYVMTFFTLSDFGVNAVVVKDFADNEEEIKSKFSKVLGFRLALGLLLTFIAIFILGFMPYDDTIKRAILVSLPIILLNSIYKAQSIVFQSKLQYKYQFISSLGMSVIAVLSLILFIIYGQGDLVGLMLVIMLAWIVAPLIGSIYVRDYVSLRVKWIDLDYWWYVFRDALPIGLALILNVLMIQADRFMLSVIDTPTSVGIYNLAYKIFEIFIILPTFLMNALYPLMAKLFGDSYKKYLKLVNITVGGLFISGVFLSFILIILSKFGIPLIWGEEMAPSFVPLAILTSGLALFYVSAPLSRVAVLDNKQRYLPLIYLVALLLNISLNMIFIPSFSYVGASVVTVISELVALIGVYLLVGRGLLKIRYMFEWRAFRGIFKDKL